MRVRISILALLMSVTAVYAYTGPGSGGGGGSIIRFPTQKGYMLLDRLSIHPHLASIASSLSATEAAERCHKDSRKKYPRVSQLIPKDRVAITIAKMRLEAWKRALLSSQRPSLVLISMIEDAIDKMSFLRTSHRISTIQRFDLPASLKSRATDLDTAILYLPKCGSIISAPLWDCLDAETKAGLIVHEAIRQVQGAYLFSDLTDKQLQLITAQIMDVAPSSTVSFESFMSPSLRNLTTLMSLVLPSSDAAICTPNGDVSNQLVLQGPGSALEHMLNDGINLMQHERASSILGSGYPDVYGCNLTDWIRQGILKP